MKWVKLSEENYATFVENIDFIETGWNNIVRESTSDQLDQNLRLKIIYDLFFYALRFCALEKFSFKILISLWNLVEEELDYLVNNRDNSNTTIFANSNVEVAELSFRYKQKVRNKRIGITSKLLTSILYID